MDNYNDDIYLLKNEITQLRQEIADLRREMKRMFSRLDSRTIGEKLIGDGPTDVWYR